MHETRVNLKHLLEDIRDSYALPTEEAIITELVSNALDSGASRIEFFLDPKNCRFTLRDNGQGMTSRIIEEYHNIASTTKVRGKGIGFAGIGAKLSLLISKSVITETKGAEGFHCATQWFLLDEHRAPWQFIANPERIAAPRGTSVTIELLNSASPLLSPEFVSNTLRKHFYPLLDPKIKKFLSRRIYRKTISFFINDRELLAANGRQYEIFKTIRVLAGGKQKKVSGFGYLAKTKEILPAELAGVSISTYGKIIKRGWEWLGIVPRSVFQIQGLVEVPDLAEILTTGKNDFLKDTASLSKYYRSRKAIQEAIIPVLSEFGEAELAFEKDLKRLKPLEKVIKKTLRYLLVEFPELTSLVGMRKRTPALNPSPKLETPEVQIILAGQMEKELLEETAGTQDEICNQPEKKRKKKPGGILIGFENAAGANLARLINNAILVDTLHPAYHKAKEENSEEYHILLCVAWILSKFVEESHSPQEFISRFLASWAVKDQGTLDIPEVKQ